MVGAASLADDFVNGYHCNVDEKQDGEDDVDDCKTVHFGREGRVLSWLENLLEVERLIRWGKREIVPSLKILCFWIINQFF